MGVRDAASSEQPADPRSARAGSEGEAEVTGLTCATQHSRSEVEPGLEETRKLVDTTRDEVECLRNLVSALVCCLTCRGLLREEEVPAQLHRLRFAAVLQQYPFECQTSVAEAMQLTEIRDAVLRYAGLASMLHLRTACKDLHCSMPASNLRDQSCAKVFICGGESNGQHLRSMEVFDLGAGVWTPMPPMGEGRSWAAAAAGSGCLYICGGNSGRQVLSSAECYDTSSGTWRKLPPMALAREGAAAVVVYNQLIVVGGGDGSMVLSEVESLQPHADAWRRLPPMLCHRMGCGAAVIDGVIYVCGGTCGEGCLNTAERFVPMFYAWERLPGMSQRRERFAAAAADGYVYVCGGGEHGQVHASAERYNPVTEAWQGLPAMPSRVLGMAAASAAGQLLVLGGSYGRQDLKAAVRYDPRASKWECVQPMLAPRNLAVAVSMRF